MLQNKAPQSFRLPSDLDVGQPTLAETEVYSIASKVFILGEYAVLAKLPAVIATLSPRFSMKVFEARTDLKPEFAEKSPIGKLIQWARQMNLPDLHFVFQDPYQGAGGFGASTAQFAMAYLAYSQRNRTQNERSPEPTWPRNHWKSIWNLYRKLTSEPGVLSPSGTDLIAQWQGGIVFVEFPGSHFGSPGNGDGRGDCKEVGPLFDWSNLLCFSATHQQGRKVPTHDHLAELTQKNFPQSRLVSTWESLLKEGTLAIHENDPRKFGQVMDSYAETLAEYGWEVPATREDRIFLRKLPGVLGVKGSGAMQSDAILVLMNQASPVSDREKVIEAAASRGLNLVADGLTNQTGIGRDLKCENRS